MLEKGMVMLGIHRLGQFAWFTSKDFFSEWFENNLLTYRGRVKITMTKSPRSDFHMGRVDNSSLGEDEEGLYVLIKGTVLGDGGGKFELLLYPEAFFEYLRFGRPESEDQEGLSDQEHLVSQDSLIKEEGLALRDDPNDPFDPVDQLDPVGQQDAGNQEDLADQDLCQCPCVIRLLDGHFLFPKY